MAGSRKDDRPPPPGPPASEATETLTSCPACDSLAFQFHLWGKSRYTPLWYGYNKCSACELVFVNPRPPEQVTEGLAEQAEGMSGFYKTRFDFDRPEFAFNIVGPASRLAPPIGAGGEKRKWLDIGCATGNLLEVARGRGYAAAGLEINGQMIEWIKANRPEIETHIGTLDALPRDAQYDVISADNVLEHIHRPRAFLVQARDHLRPGGLLAIRVPNYRNFARRLLSATGGLPQSYIIDPDAHPCNYSRKSLTRLIERCEFTPVRVMEHLTLSYPLKIMLDKRTAKWPAAARRITSALYPATFVFDRVIPRGGIDITIFARRAEDA